jgi:uncharacterized phiE125 gp8 family phage protein
MALKIVTAPAVEPITLAEAKSHIKAFTNDEDALIQIWITAARRRAETFMQRRLITQTWDYFRDCFPCWGMEIPNAPLQSVTSVKYVDNAGAEQTLGAAKYLVDANADPGRITPAYAEVWPVTREQMSAVTIRFVCGYGLAAVVPEEIKSAILLMIAHLEQHRSEVAAAEMFEMPRAADHLLGPYRVTRF